MRARLAARLSANETPAVWLLAVIVCRVVRSLSRNRARWSSRLGHALEQLDKAREARLEAAPAGAGWSALVLLSVTRGDAARQLRLARRRERAADWAAAAAAYRAAVQHDGAHPAWWHRLGWCLRESGDLAGAAEAIRTACDLDGTNPRWFSLLGDIEEASGRLPAALAARERAVQVGGADHPRWRVKLAALHEQVGQWDRAYEILRANIERYPRYALSHRRLGEVGLNLAYLGGTFVGTMEGRSSGTFQLSPWASAAPARQALERAAELEPAKTAWRMDLAEARSADGDLPGAIALYESALRDAEQSTGRWVLGVKQRWQFQLETMYHRLGQARVEDPLFSCTVQPAGPTVTTPDNAGQPREPEPIAGLFSAQTTFGGITVAGLVAAEDCDQVEIVLDGVPLRTVNLSGDTGPGGSYFPQFSLEIKRSTLASFPREGKLEVRTPGGTRLRGPGGVDRLLVCVPHGSGRLLDIIAAGGRLGKKGAMSPSLEETRLRQQRYLEIYTQVRDFFENELGRSLFLMYGTLLGYYREGDFIPGDDDFDAGYVSDQADPVAVKEETKQLIVKLVSAGFTVSFNRKGRLFRVQLEREATDGFHLDVRPVWFQDGNLWAHNHCSFPTSWEDFLPVVEGELRGVPVSVPRGTEAFLHGHYGPGWKVPDPGFMYYMSEIDQAVLDNLSKALITVREYKELAERVRREAGESPPAGRLVSVGSQDLYPLDDFLA